MSGGLDSSTVTAFAAREVGADSGRLAAFSIVASMTSATDESDYQRAFLQMYPLAHHTLDADAHLSFATVATVSPCHPSKGLVYGPLRRAAADLFASNGVVTHLTGRGGDNVFCGAAFPPYYLGDVLKRLELRRWWREARQWAARGNRSLFNLLWRCSLATPDDPYAGAVGTDTVVPDWLTPAFREVVSAAAAEPWRGGERTFDSVARDIHFRSIRLAAASQSFTQAGEERCPLLYRPLVEFVLSIPWQHLINPREDRVIQRRALAGVLPEPIRRRTTKAIGTDILLRSVREHRTGLAAVAEGHRLSALGLVDAAAFRQACERFRHGLLGRQLPFLAAALSLEMWLANQDAGAASRSASLPGDRAVLQGSARGAYGSSTRPRAESDDAWRDRRDEGHDTGRSHGRSLSRPVL
jgi:asparagine synthase (glutamine-hydrolysing)